jgi:hypothetical protein
MIEAATEKLLSLAQAAEWLSQRRGKTIHKSTLYRWTTMGCRGVVLEHIQIGGTRSVSVETLQEFFERLTINGGQKRKPTTSRSVVQMQRRSEAAAKELEGLGI